MAKNRKAAEDSIDQDDSPEPKVAKGKSLNRSDADLALLSLVSTRDIRDARADWKAGTIPEYGGLIEATLDPDPLFDTDED